MSSQPSLAGSKRSESVGRARQQIERLVRERLLGRRIDGVAFMEDLLAIATQVGEVHCSPVADQGLRFELPGAEPFEVEVDVNRGKLRMLCARLAMLCHESGHDFLPYGGEGTIDRIVQAQRIDRESEPISYFLSWQARWKNTPSEHWFVITA